MPFEIAVSRNARVGVIRLTGEVDGREITAAAAALATHPEWEGGFRAVWDTSRTVSLDFRPDHLAALLEQERRLHSAGATGDLVVIADDPVWVSLVHLFEKKDSEAGRAVSTVATVADAEALLGVALPS